MSSKKDLEKAVERLQKKHRAVVCAHHLSEAVIMAILEQTGPVKVKRERLNEIVNGEQEALVAYDPETDEYAFKA